MIEQQPLWRLRFRGALRHERLGKCTFRPSQGGIWDYRPKDGYLEPIM